VRCCCGIHRVRVGAGHPFDDVGALQTFNGQACDVVVERVDLDADLEAGRAGIRPVAAILDRLEFGGTDAAHRDAAEQVFDVGIVV